MKIQDFRLAKLEYDEAQNILFYRVKGGTDIDVPEILEMIDYVKTLIGERQHMALVDFGDLTSSTEARQAYAVSEYINTYRLADAFLVKSTAVRLTANFFIKVIKPKVTTKMFSEEADAVEWLNKLPVYTLV